MSFMYLSMMGIDNWWGTNFDNLDIKCTDDQPNQMFFNYNYAEILLDFIVTALACNISMV